MNIPAITPTLIAEAGVDIEEDKIPALIEHLNEELEERVGEEITNVLDDEKLAELVELQKTATDEEVGVWLEANVDELEAIVQDEIDILIGELSENAEKL